jgi:hypothetical protein
VFGKSITRRPTQRAAHLSPVPGLPWRTFALAFLAMIASVYAIVRHYTRPAAPEIQPATREIPAPDLEVTPVDGNHAK